MLAQRSLIRPPQMDSEGSYDFASLLLDGYSGGDTMDGYLMALVLQDGYQGGQKTLTMDAHTGAINQIGTGQVSFNGNVDAKNGLDVTGANLTVSTNAHIQGWTIIEGDLTVNGTTTTIDTQQLVIADPITVINASGSEIPSDWTGLSGRDGDGYNRTGWVFSGAGVAGLDGYWGLSTVASAVSQPDAVPNRAIAYLGKGDGYGDLSSRLSGNDGASKIGFNGTPPFDAGSTNVHAALIELHNDISNATSWTDSHHYTINNDANPNSLETSCLIQKAGDGTGNLYDSYYCLITDPAAYDYIQFAMHENSLPTDTHMEVGTKGSTANVSSCIELNSGNGSVTHSASLCIGANGTLTLNSPTTVQITGNDVKIGSPGKCVEIAGNICSNITPCCNDAYQLGNPTHEFKDGYFKDIHMSGEVYSNSLHVSGTTTTNDFTATGDVTLGTPGECIKFLGNICSSIIPCCDDAYQIGDPSHRFLDGYFGNLWVDNEHIANLIIDNTTVHNIDVDGYLHVTGQAVFNGCVTFGDGLCSNITPCCNDAYQLGNSTHEFKDGYFKDIHMSGEVYSNSLHVTGDAYFNNIHTTGTLAVIDFTATGDVTLGTPGECIKFLGNICSSIIPCCNDAYQIGDPTHKFLDGYFENLWVGTEHISNLIIDNTTINNITIDGYMVVHGLTTFDGCVDFNGGLCSSITPCCNDAYNLGNPTHRFNDGYFNMLNASGNVTLGPTTVASLHDTGNATLDGNVTLGSPGKCIKFLGSICSDIKPCCDDAYQIGDSTHSWIDGYFMMPTFTNITPVGGVDSLIGVLKGIDTALGNATVPPPRGLYRVTSGESGSYSIDTSRVVDQGVSVNVSGLTDAQFRDYIYIYWNGQLLWNDPTSAANQGVVQHDVARKTGGLKTILFAAKVQKNSVIQIVDMR